MISAMAPQQAQRARDEWIDYHLDNWARWLCRGGGTRGYPARAVGCTSWGDAWDDEDRHARIADQHAAITDAVIADLPHAERLAILHRYAIAVVRWRPGVYAEALARGREKVRRGLTRRGVVVPLVS